MTFPLTNTRFFRNPDSGIRVAYRYGFNSQEKETQITGGETHTSAEFWMYDARAGRRWNVDPILKYHMSAYSCLSNNPINRNDIKGNTDDKANSSNPNDPNKKGGKEKFHKETTDLRKDQQEKINEKEVTTLPDVSRQVAFQPDVGDEGQEIQNPAELNVAETMIEIAEDIWYSPVARYLVPDYFNVGGNLQTSSGAYLTEELTFTFMLRGKDPGIYFNTTTGFGGCTSVGVDVGCSFGSGYYLGDAHKLSSDMISGWQSSATVGLGGKAILGGDVNGSVDMGYDDNNNPSTITGKVGISFGLGISTPFLQGGLGGGYGTKALPIFKF